MKTVRELIETSISRLQEAGIESPRWDAELLVAHGLGIPRLALYSYPERPVAGKALKFLTGLVAQRSRRVPFQYLAGHVEFWGLSFRVTPDVLIPRPETEGVVEAALRYKGRFERKERTTIADIGTGSGCLAVALASEFSGAEVYATDISIEALSVAMENARSHGNATQIRFLAGNRCDPLKRAGLSGKIDLMVSNPPYVPRDSIQGLQAEIRDYEPRIALDGGVDGLAFYRRLFEEARPMLAPQGVLIVEIGLGQEADLDTLAVQLGWKVLEWVPDLAGIPRITILSAGA
jgi:release factor glutamine methyltransferase